ncbi:PAS domain-containing protein [Flammeovirga sp. MY04]|uniref:sensor histidine kinase n=1 Tax=Flammeovirga sp. MY04 TaxID=1191459 RepID=UPI00080641F4|nr:ATP-binding protein [Flammeovirga sp. MY04]ANQ48795.1 PAS domain-containing protein [Flammeovirga sp. MY04]
MTTFNNTISLNLNDPSLHQLIVDKLLHFAILDGIGTILDSNHYFDLKKNKNSIHSFFDFSKEKNKTPNALLKRTESWIGQIHCKITHRKHAVLITKIDSNYLWISFPTKNKKEVNHHKEVLELRSKIIQLTAKEKKLHALIQAQALPQLINNDKSLLSDLPLEQDFSTQDTQAIYDNEERQRLSIQASKEGLWDWNHLTRKVFYSKAFYKMLGYDHPSKEKDITTLLSMIHPEDRVTVMKALQRDILVKDGFQLTFKMIDHEGNLLWTLLKTAVQRDINGKVTRVIGKHSDITSIKSQSENIQKAVIDTEDKERERFAKEIHDGMGQTLTASLYLLDEFIKNSETINSEENKQLCNIREKVREAIKEGRNIAHNIMPTSIEERGLCGSIEKIANYYKDISDKSLYFFHKYDQKSLSLSKQLLLLRVTQEAITNSFKHGKADNVNISIIQDIDLLQITIEDNGTGFNVEEKLNEEKKSGLGLQNMKQRVSSIGGKIHFESSSNYGTCILIEVPIFTN